MDGGKCILQVRGVRPFFSDKFDITRHKQYPLLLDYDSDNEFDIEKSVKRKKRKGLKLTPKDRVTEFGVDMTDAGQEVKTAVTETDTTAETSEETEVKEKYIGLTSDSEETE